MTNNARQHRPGDQTQSEQAQSEQAQSEQAQSEQAQSEQAQSEQRQPDRTPPDQQPGEAAAIPGVDVGRTGDHVDVTLPGQSGHRAPGERAELVDAVLDDEQVRQAEHVTLAVPRGDTEALLHAKDRLGDAQTRPAGASIIVESDLPGPAQRDEHPEDEPGPRS